MARVKDLWRDRHGRPTRLDGKGLRWQAVWADPLGRERTKAFRVKERARQYAADMEGGVRRGDYVEPGTETVTYGNWAERWRRTWTVTPKTKVSYESLLSTQVLPRWGTVPLGRIEFVDVAAWVSEMADRQSASRTRQAYHLFKSSLDMAVKGRQGLRTNPATGVALPKLPASSRQYLTHEQVHDLVRGLEDRDALPILVLAYVGLRWAELAGLQVRDVDLLRGRIQVARTLGDVSGVLVVGDPKNHQRRSVAFPASLRDGLATLLAGRDPEEWLFTSLRGMPLRVNRFRLRVFDRAAVAAGLGGLTPHELRHTAASLMVDAGANVLAVARQLGHADPSITLRVYADLFDNQLDDVAERMDVAFRGVGKRSENGVILVAPERWGRDTGSDLR
jgi:integrase